MRSCGVPLGSVGLLLFGVAVGAVASPVFAARAEKASNLFTTDAEVSLPPTEAQSDALHRKLLSACPTGYVVISMDATVSGGGQSVHVSYGCFDGFGAVQDVMIADHPVPEAGAGGMFRGVKLGRSGARFAVKIEPNPDAQCVPRRIYAQRRYEIYDIELFGYWHSGGYEARLLRESAKNIDGTPHPCWSVLAERKGVVEIVHPVAGQKFAADAQPRVIELSDKIATDLDILAAPRFDVRVGPDGSDAWDAVRLEYVAPHAWPQAWMDAALAQRPRARYILVGDMLDALQRTPPAYREEIVQSAAVELAEDIRAVLFDLQTLVRRRMSIDTAAAALLVKGIKRLPASKFGSAASVVQSIVDVAANGEKPQPSAP